MARKIEHFVFAAIFLMSFIVKIEMANKNVLFIMVDDLRPELSFLAGERSNQYSGISTPNMDALAARSLVLKRAYVQQAICGPSRASLLTGRRPDTTRVYDTVSNFRLTGGNFSTIPEYFKDNGYISAGMGKIFHNDDSQSWSSEYTYYHPTKKYKEGNTLSWKSVENDDPVILNNRLLTDEQLADNAKSTLADFSSGGTHENETFFIAVGFHKPHLPFYFMEDYEINGTVGLADNPYVPDDFPNIAWNGYAELRKYDDIKADNATGDFNTSVSDTKAEELRKAYFGAIMWIDSLVGEVVQEVTDLGLENDTIIALLGDHGWHLGEHNLWCKQSNFEESTWTPLMFHIPGQTDAGINSTSLVEFVDIFPTLAEAAGLTSLPSCPDDSGNVRVCTEGLSLMDLISEPTKELRNGSISQNTRQRNGGATQYMGYTLRTKLFRYTEWAEFNTTNYHPDWSTVSDVELYDLTNDPRENFNLAADTSYNATKAQLSAELQNAVYSP